MNQSELNRKVAEQLGESITEIARRGFSLVEDTPQPPATVQSQKNNSTITTAA